MRKHLGRLFVQQIRLPLTSAAKCVILILPKGQKGVVNMKIMLRSRYDVRELMRFMRGREDVVTVFVNGKFRATYSSAKGFKAAGTWRTPQAVCAMRIRQLEIFIALRKEHLAQ